MGVATVVSDEEGEFDFPAGTEGTTQLQRFTVVDGSIVDNHPGLDDAGVIAAELATANEFSLTQERNATIKVMKTRAGTILENNRWKVDKAREQDELNGTSTLAAVLQSREDIRILSNTKEDLVNTMTDVEAIRATRLETTDTRISTSNGGDFVEIF